MKNVFHFTLKALLVFKIFKFLFCLLGHGEKRPDYRKIMLISKFMTSQPGQQTIAIHILTNISRSKGNQAIIFGQLTERNMRNIFFEKSYTKCDGDTIPRLFPKKSKLSISRDQYSKASYSLLLWYTKLTSIRT